MPTDDLPHPALRAALTELAERKHLRQDHASAVFLEVMTGEASADQIAALLVGLKEKGEAAAEIAGAVVALRSAMLRVAYHTPDGLVDTCGTGGGAITTINVSTAAAIVASAAGVPVAKHGNRSFTSRSGSADVLEAMGVPIDLSPSEAATVLDRLGIVFLFAPQYHPAMRHVAAVRRQLGVPTLMNLVGPLANPAGAGRQVVGVADPGRALAIAEALALLGVVHGLVVHAEIGMDEIAPVGTTRLWDIRAGEVRESTFDPASVGLGTATLDGLEGGEPGQNAARIIALMDRPDTAPPALRAAILLNAAAAIHVGGKTATLGEAAEQAAVALHSGAARARLELLRGAREGGTGERHG